MDYWELIFPRATILTNEPVISMISDCFRASVVGMTGSTDCFGRLSEESIPKRYSSKLYKNTHKALGAYVVIEHDDGNETLMKITCIVRWKHDRNIYVGGVFDGKFMAKELNPDLPIVCELRHYHYFPLNK